MGGCRLKWFWRREEGGEKGESEIFRIWKSRTDIIRPAFVFMYGILKNEIERAIFV